MQSLNITTTTSNTQLLGLEIVDGNDSKNPALVYIKSLESENSQRVMRSDLMTIAGMLGYTSLETCPWHELRYEHTTAIRARLMGVYSAATASRMLSALRGTLTAAWDLELMKSDDYMRAVKIKGKKGETLPAGRALSPGEIAALFANCQHDPTPAGARDAAMLAGMYPGGLRRDEVISLDLADYDPESGGLKVRHGKGNKARIAYITNGAKRALSDWLAIRGDEPGPLFLAVNKGGIIAHGRRLTNQAVYNALAKRGKLAGVGDISPHDLRRSVISDLLDAGADIAVIAKLVGHESIDTTKNYDRRPEAAKAKAAGLLHVPYNGRGGR